jgi:calcium-dependent protein kinase
MKYILSGIAYCHEKGLVHCDLKPENILLASSDPEETLMKIIDFGNSSFCKPGDRLESKFGSVYYVAPEVLKSSYNEKCDVWSLGVILFLLLSGKPPFNGNNDQAILTKVYKGEYSMDGPEWANIS